MTYELTWYDSMQRVRVNGEFAGELTDSAEITLCRELFTDVPVSTINELGKAMRAEYAGEGSPVQVAFSDQPARYFQGDDAVIGPLMIVNFENGDIVAYVDIATGDYDQEDRWPEVEALLTDWAPAQGYRFDEFKQSEYGPVASDVWIASFHVDQYDAPLGPVLDFLDSAAAFVQAFASANYDSDLVKSVVRAGLATALIGVHESQTIEAKRSLRLDGNGAANNKFELAKDVAAMANSTSGGVIVVGAETKGVDGRDVIVQLHPVRDAQAFVRRIRATIEANVYPVPDGLEVESVPVRGSGDRELVIISVPSQDPMIQPFIVSGVVLDGRLRSSLLSVPIRSGEDTRFLGKAAIHSALSVGRAVLNGRYKLALSSDADDPQPCRVGCHRPAGHGGGTGRREVRLNSDKCQEVNGQLRASRRPSCW